MRLVIACARWCEDLVFGKLFGMPVMVVAVGIPAIFLTMQTSCSQRRQSLMEEAKALDGEYAISFCVRPEHPPESGVIEAEIVHTKPGYRDLLRLQDIGNGFCTIQKRVMDDSCVVRMSRDYGVRKLHIFSVPPGTRTRRSPEDPVKEAPSTTVIASESVNQVIFRFRVIPQDTSENTVFVGPVYGDEYIILPRSMSY